LRIAGLAWLAGVVVRDVLRPEYDPVRPYLDLPPPSGAHARPGEAPASTAAGATP
jgi:hypothetical protein